MVIVELQLSNFLKKLAIHRSLDDSIEAKTVVFNQSLLDHYYGRDENLKDLCIYEFASSYHVIYTRRNGQKLRIIKEIEDLVSRKVVTIDAILTNPKNTNIIDGSEIRCEIYSFFINFPVIKNIKNQLRI